MERLHIVGCREIVLWLLVGAKAKVSASFGSHLCYVH